MALTVGWFCWSMGDGYATWTSLLVDRFQWRHGCLRHLDFNSSFFLTIHRFEK